MSDPNNKTADWWNTPGGSRN